MAIDLQESLWRYRREFQIFNVKLKLTVERIIHNEFVLPFTVYENGQELRSLMISLNLSIAFPQLFYVHLKLCTTHNCKNEIHRCLSEDITTPP